MLLWIFFIIFGVNLAPNIIVALSTFAIAKFVDNYREVDVGRSISIDKAIKNMLK